MNWLNRILGKKPETGDFSFLETDMHSHLIPAMDDGSRSPEDSLNMIGELQRLGYRKIITTPHIKWDYFKNTARTIREAYERLLPEVQRCYPDLTFEVAAEYYLDEHFIELIRQKELLTFSGNKVLMEFSFVNRPVFHEQVFFDLSSAGYQPVLAHFERYPYYHGSLKEAESWRKRGVWIQLNLNSLSGHYGKEVRQQAIDMIESGCVDLVGTDCHRMQHLQVMESLLTSRYLDKLKNCTLKNTEL